MKSVWCILLTILSWEVSAQEQLDGTPSIRYTANFGVGLVFDDDPAEWSLQLIQGVRYHRWSVGLGVGAESHGSLHFYPLFGSASWDAVVIGRTSLFLQLNAGSSNVRIDNASDWSEEVFQSDKGLMLNPNAGLRVNAGDFHFTLSAGYKFMEGNYRVNNLIWSSTTQEVTRVEVREIIVQIGIGLH